jgi:hypothetical protein
MTPNSNLTLQKILPVEACDGVAITGWAPAWGRGACCRKKWIVLLACPLGNCEHERELNLSYAAEGETELTLGTQAMRQALAVAGCVANEIDWIIASSETHVEYPSLAAQLHKRTKVR